MTKYKTLISTMLLSSFLSFSCWGVQTEEFEEAEDSIIPALDLQDVNSEHLQAAREYMEMATPITNFANMHNVSKFIEYLNNSENISNKINSSERKPDHIIFRGNNIALVVYNNGLVQIFHNNELVQKVKFHTPTLSSKKTHSRSLSISPSTILFDENKKNKQAVIAIPDSLDIKQYLENLNRFYKDVKFYKSFKPSYGSSKKLDKSYGSHLANDRNQSRYASGYNANLAMSVETNVIMNAKSVNVKPNYKTERVLNVLANPYYPNLSKSLKKTKAQPLSQEIEESSAIQFANNIIE